MNINVLQKKLFAAARATPPAERVPYAFEQRIMAQLQPAPVADAWSEWGAALWRAAGPCVAVMLLAGVWTFIAGEPVASADSFAVALEETVQAPLDPGDAL